jgi:hypothetical protein
VLAEPLLAAHGPRRLPAALQVPEDVVPPLDHENLLQVTKQPLEERGEHDQVGRRQAYGTSLQFGEGEFNFVKVRAGHGTGRAFEVRDEHFEVPGP